MGCRIGSIGESTEDGPKISTQDRGKDCTLLSHGILCDGFAFGSPPSVGMHGADTEGDVLETEST